MLEIALWLEQLVQGSVDSSYHAAAHTRLAIGGRHLDARVIRAAAIDDELRFALGLATAPP